MIPVTMSTHTDSHTVRHVHKGFEASHSRSCYIAPRCPPSSPTQIRVVFAFPSSCSLFRDWNDILAHVHLLDFLRMNHILLKFKLFTQGTKSPQRLFVLCSVKNENIPGIEPPFVCGIT